MDSVSEIVKQVELESMKNIDVIGVVADNAATLIVSPISEGGVISGSTKEYGMDSIFDSNGNITLGTGNDIVRFSSTDATYRLWIGHATAASAALRVTKAGVLYASGAVISGTITASAIHIPDENTTANSWHCDSDGNTWWGCTHANYIADPNNATASITKAGAIRATNIVLTGLQAGSSLDGQYVLANSIGSAAANLALRNWTITCAFSSASDTQVNWGIGNLILSDGTSYAISASNTGAMASRTYIYFDVAISTTALQITTTASTAVGNGKLLIATAINATGGATFQVFGGVGGLFLAGDQIVANSIAANKLSVSSLSAIAADMGSITAGTIVLSSSGYIRAGQTAYDTGTGFWLGIDGATPKFSIGNSSGNKMTWDGTNLAITGALNGSKTSTTSGTNVNTLTLSSIPAADLYKVVIYINDAVQDRPCIRFNGDSGNNYRYRRTLNGVTSANIAPTNLIDVYGANYSVSTPHDTAIDFTVNGTAASYKVVTGLMTVDDAGTENVNNFVGTWYDNTNALSSITVFTNGGNNFSSIKIIVIGYSA